MIVQITLEDLTASECIELYRNRHASPVEVIDDCLKRIDAANPTFNAFCFVNDEEARRTAQESEARWMRGEPLGPLDGVPATIKELSLTRGMPTVRGSAAVRDDGPWDVDAPVVARMREAGAILIGKTTSPEFGWKGVTDSRVHGFTRNPWNPDLTPGGSSGGAGVAAALNLGFLHQGSDGGGSIRIPASFTGTFGFKPTFGYVPVWPFSVMTGLAHLGPMTRTVTDAILMMTVISRPDPRDGWAAPAYPGTSVAPGATLSGLRIAYSRNMGYGNVAPEIAKVTDAAVGQIEALGAEVVHVDPGFDNPIDVWATLWFAGAARIYSSIEPERRSLLDPGFLDCAEKGRALTCASYQDAQQACYEISARMAEFHERYDLLVTPTIPVPPFPVGQNVPNESVTGWVDWTPFTYPFNLTQQPAASLPAGLDENGLPVGLQLVGARYNDPLVLSVAYILETRLGRLTPPRGSELIRKSESRS
ncbi:amidase [Ensifer sp. IC4062]|nr:amidase [Ensifer sp. IC4062]